MTDNVNKGKTGEKIAEEFLRSQGYKLIERNYRYGRNEIDLIMLDEKKKILIFIEVKTRWSKKFGEPEDSITKAKQEGFKKAVMGYMSKHTEFEKYDLRIDTVGIVLSANIPSVNHIENSFY